MLNLRVRGVGKVTFKVQKKVVMRNKKLADRVCRYGCLLLVMLVFAGFYPVSAYAVALSPLSFTKDGFATEKALITERYLQDETQDQTAIYIGYRKTLLPTPPSNDPKINRRVRMFVEGKALYENKTSYFKEGYLTAILVGNKWCNKQGCKLVKLYQDEQGHWQELFSTVSNGGIWHSDYYPETTDLIPLYCISDNAGGKGIGYKDGKWQELVYEKGLKCGYTVPEIEAYGGKQ